MNKKQNFNNTDSQQLNIADVRHSLFCKIFGHRFEKIYDEKISPENGDVIYELMRGIKNGSSSFTTDNYLHRKISVNKIQRVYIKTYCKRCGMIV